MCATAWADLEEAEAARLVAAHAGALRAEGLAFPTQRELDAHAGWAPPAPNGQRRSPQKAAEVEAQRRRADDAKQQRLQQALDAHAAEASQPQRAGGGAAAGSAAASADELAALLGGSLSIKEGGAPNAAAEAAAPTPAAGPAARDDADRRASRRRDALDPDDLAGLVESALSLSGRQASAPAGPVKSKAPARLTDSHGSLDALLGAPRAAPRPPRARQEAASGASAGIPRRGSAPGALPAPEDPLRDTAQSRQLAPSSSSDATLSPHLRSLLKHADPSAPLTDDGDDRRTLYPYQQSAVLSILKQERVILAYDMGLGKTLIALVAARAWARSRGAKVVVLAPKSVLESWRREAAAADVAIDAHSWAKAHYMQSPKAKRTRDALALALAPSCVACVLITGTPMRNGDVANLVPLLQAARERRLADDPKGFVRRYKGDLAALHRATRHVVLRRTKAQCVDLPPKTRVVLRADPSAAERSAYARAVAEARRRRGGEGGRGGDALALLSAVRRAASLAKVGAALGVCEELLQQGRSVVVFAAFLDTVDALRAGLAAAGAECHAVVGGQAAAERQRAVDAFQREGGGARAIVCTFGAGGVGLTLTAASDVVLVDRPWAPGDAAQAEDRVHRIGAPRPVTAVWLTAFDVDRHVDAVVGAKSEAAARVVDDGHPGGGARRDAHDAARAQAVARSRSASASSASSYTTNVVAAAGTTRIAAAVQPL
eukprot:PRCOL_00003710-RA